MSFSLEVKSLSDRRVRITLPHTINRTRLALTRLSESQIHESVIAAIAKNEASGA
jgi:hypothetical protein